MQNHIIDIKKRTLKNGDLKDLIYLENGQILSIGSNGVSLFQSIEHHDEYTKCIMTKKDPVFIKYFDEAQIKKESKKIPVIKNLGKIQIDKSTHEGIPDLYELVPLVEINLSLEQVIINAIGDDSLVFNEINDINKIPSYFKDYLTLEELLFDKIDYYLSDLLSNIEEDFDSILEIGWEDKYLINIDNKQYSYKKLVNELKNYFWKSLPNMIKINYIKYLVFEKNRFNKIAFIFAIVKFLDINVNDLELISRHNKLFLKFDPFVKKQDLKNEIDTIFSELKEYQNIFKLNKSEELLELDRYKLFLENRINLFLNDNNIYLGTRALGIESACVGASKERKMTVRDFEKFEKMKQVDLYILRKFI
jgi:hypothetical protein